MKAVTCVEVRKAKERAGESDDRIRVLRELKTVHGGSHGLVKFILEVVADHSLFG